MAEAKAEVMEEIEDGRDEAEEEDAVEAASVRPGEGREPCRPGGGGWEGAWEASGEFPSVSPQLRGHWLPRHRLRKTACGPG